MPFWGLLAIGALCLVGGFVLIIKGVGHSESGTTIKIFGAEFQLSKVGPGTIFALFGVVIIFIAAKLSLGTEDKKQEPQKQPFAAQFQSFEYQRIGGHELGKFERDGERWKETFSDTQARFWIEDDNSAPPGRVRLKDGQAIIDIEPASNTVYYTDPGYPGYPWPKPLDEIVKIERHSG